MKCDIKDYSTDGITSLTHLKKIHYTPEKPFDFTKCGKGFRNIFRLHQHYQEIMYKTKYTLSRHTNSEEYLKVKTKV